MHFGADVGAPRAPISGPVPPVLRKPSILFFDTGTDTDTDTTLARTPIPGPPFRATPVPRA
jgi:hypothetical protein